MTDDLFNAGITAKERLGNIEEVLKSIDSKLDGKADQSYVVALELRVRELEIVGSNKRLDAVESRQGAMGRTVAVGVGVVSTVVVVANVIAPLVLK